MKKQFFIIVLLSSYFITFGQEKVRNTEDILSLKVGIIGGWLNFEKSISNNSTINSEIGYIGGFIKQNDDKFKYVFTSEISIEPRYYYNFNKRLAKGKDIDNNSANYVAIDFYYIPDLLTITNNDNILIDQSLNIVPKWGLKRQINDKLSLEFALGLGYSFNFDNESNLATGLDLKICLHK